MRALTVLGETVSVIWNGYRNKRKSRCVGLLFLVTTVSMVAGCSTRAWYEAMQEKAKQDCLHQPPSEQARCEVNRNKDDFQTYEKNRTQK